MSGASSTAAPRRFVNFVGIASAAAANAEGIVRRWLPDGHRDVHEWVSRNPTREDRKPGSFKINLKTGAWADFATCARGGDLISLAAMLFKLNQKEAAMKVADMLGMDPFA